MTCWRNIQECAKTLQLEILNYTFIYTYAHMWVCVRYLDIIPKDIVLTMDLLLLIYSHTCSKVCASHVIQEEDKEKKDPTKVINIPWPYTDLWVAVVLSCEAIWLYFITYMCTYTHFWLPSVKFVLVVYVYMHVCVYVFIYCQVSSLTLCGGAVSIA